MENEVKYEWNLDDAVEKAAYRSGCPRNARCKTRHAMSGLLDGPHAGSVESPEAWEVASLHHEERHKIRDRSKNNAKIRPEPDQEDAFPRASDSENEI